MPTKSISEQPGHFEGSLRTLELGPQFLATLSFRPLQVLRTPRLVRASDPELFQLVLLLRGGLSLAHADRDSTLVPGQMVLYDSSRPFQASVTASQGSARLVQVQFPKSPSPLPVDRLELLVGTPLTFRSSVGGVLSDFILSLVRRPGAYNPSDTTRLGSALLDLITAALVRELDGDSLLPAEPRNRTLMFCIQRYIEHHLGYPGLSPLTVAEAHGISLSRLYKLFNEHDLAPAAWIRERRLERCRNELADPRLSSRPVHAIAARWGFASSAHFSRTFRAAYGLAPADYRHAAGQHGRVPEQSSTGEAQSTTHWT